MVQRVSCQLLTMATWVCGIYGGHSANERVLFRVLQFSLVSAITYQCHISLVTGSVITQSTTVQITTFSSPYTPNEDEVSTGRLHVNDNNQCEDSVLLKYMLCTGHVITNSLKNHNAFMFSVKNSRTAST